jgi:hypothetical protein
MGMPLEQSGVKHLLGGASTTRTADSTVSGSDCLFHPVEQVRPVNTSVPNYISAMTMPLLGKFPNATTEALMAHGDLRYDDTRVGNKDACLNFNLLGVCKDRNCSYRHTKAKPTVEQIKVVTEKLKPAIISFMEAGAPTSPHIKKRKCET